MGKLLSVLYFESHSLLLCLSLLGFCCSSHKQKINRGGLQFLLRVEKGCFFFPAFLVRTHTSPLSVSVSLLLLRCSILLCQLQTFSQCNVYSMVATSTQQFSSWKESWTFCSIALIDWRFWHFPVWFDGSMLRIFCSRFFSHGFLSFHISLGSPLVRTFPTVTNLQLQICDSSYV